MFAKKWEFVRNIFIEVNKQNRRKVKIEGFYEKYFFWSLVI